MEGLGKEKDNGSTICSRVQTSYNGSMTIRNSGKLKRALSQAKNFFLVLLFLLVPFAGGFHPKIKRREDPEEKEIGNKV